MRVRGELLGDQLVDQGFALRNGLGGSFVEELEIDGKGGDAEDRIGEGDEPCPRKITNERRDSGE